MSKTSSDESSTAGNVLSLRFLGDGSTLNASN